MKSPITDKIEGYIFDSCYEKFRDVRHLAIDDYNTRKARRDKKEVEDKDVPEHKVGDSVLTVNDSARNRIYLQVSIVDFVEERWRGFVYYGIVTKASSKHPRFGRLIKFGQGQYGRRVIDISTEKIKWVYDIRDSK